MKVLVTGGAGYIGSHTCLALLELGYDVVAVDNFCNSSPESLRRVEELAGKKVPSDGLCGKTDEDNLGFTYAALDRYIREGILEDEATRARIDRLHKLNLFKLKPIPYFPYGEE